MLGASDQSPRMFKSDFLDRFSRTHWLVVPTLYIPASLFLLYMAVLVNAVPALMLILLVPAGMISWTLVEYWLHRTFFHWVPQTIWGPRMHFIVHGVHHKWSEDPYRLVMPPAVSIPLFFIFLFFWTGVFGAAGWALHAGFTIGYMLYDMTHYYVHHAKPKNTYFKQLQQHHLSHHYNRQCGERRFGVSNLVWDRVFRTR